MKGTVSYYNEEKGFGFLSPDDDKNEYWFHFTQVEGGYGEIKIGDVATFSPFFYNSKPRASNVRFKEIYKNEESKSASILPLYNATDRDGSRSAKTKKGEFVPDYSGDYLKLSEENLSRCLNAIANWKLEAKLDDIIKYFCPIPEIDMIKTGKKA